MKGAKGVSEKLFGVWTERRTEAGLIRLEAGASYRRQWAAASIWCCRAPANAKASRSSSIPLSSSTAASETTLRAQRDHGIPALRAARSFGHDGGRPHVRRRDAGGRVGPAELPAMETRLSRRRCCPASVPVCRPACRLHARRARGRLYQGKTLTVIVGFAPGGGVDTTARLVARHLARFIPGQPSVVVQNMEGAAGVVAANYLDRRVAPMGLRSPFPALLVCRGHREEPRRGVRPHQVHLDRQPRRGEFDDVRARQHGDQDIRRAANVAAHTDLRLLGQHHADRAWCRRCWLPAACRSRSFSATSRPPASSWRSSRARSTACSRWTIRFPRRLDLLTNKIVIPILQNKPTSGAPAAAGRASQKRGGAPHPALALENFGLPVVGPAGVPPERVDILRKAFVTMCADKEFQAEASKVDQPIGAPLDRRAAHDHDQRSGDGSDPRYCHGLQAARRGEVGAQAAGGRAAGSSSMGAHRRPGISISMPL